MIIRIYALPAVEGLMTNELRKDTLVHGKREICFSALFDTYAHCGWWLITLAIFRFTVYDINITNCRF